MGTRLLVPLYAAQGNRWLRRSVFLDAPVRMPVSSMQRNKATPSVYLILRKGEEFF
jgi:hypothetical protein